MSSLFAIAQDGSLFTFVYQNDERIAVYGPNSTRIEREVHIPSVGSYDPSINGLSVDHAGSTYFSWVSTGSLRRVRETSSYCPGYGYGVIVYPPHAHGHMPYSSCFPDDQAFMVYAGIAVDSLGSLYLPDLGSVLIYGSAASNPRLIRTVSGESFQGATGVALDVADRIWVIDTTAGRLLVCRQLSPLRKRQGASGAYDRVPHEAAVVRKHRGRRQVPLHWRRRSGARVRQVCKRSHFAARDVGRSLRLGRQRPVDRNRSVAAPFAAFRPQDPRCLRHNYLM